MNKPPIKYLELIRSFKKPHLEQKILKNQTKMFYSPLLHLALRRHSSLTVKKQ